MPHLRVPARAEGSDGSGRHTRYLVLPGRSRFALNSPAERSFVSEQRFKRRNRIELLQDVVPKLSAERTGDRIVRSLKRLPAVTAKPREAEILTSQLDPDILRVDRQGHRERDRARELRRRRLDEVDAAD